MAGSNLPPPQSPFVNPKDGTLSNDGNQFLIGLQNTGGLIETGSVDESVRAAGSNQASATQLTSQWNQVTSGSGGVLLSSYQAGLQQFVANTSGGGISVFPPPGAQINALGVNAAFSLSNNSSATFKFISATQIFS